MDYYSDHPCPSEEDVIKDISKSIHANTRYKMNHIIQTVKRQLDMMGGQKSLGSLSGYYVFTRKTLMFYTTQFLQRHPCLRLTFKTLTQIIIVFQRLYKTTLEKRYIPNDKGCIQARNNFTILTNEKSDYGTWNKNKQFEVNPLFTL